MKGRLDRAARVDTLIEHSMGGTVANAVLLAAVDTCNAGKCSVDAAQRRVDKRPSVSAD
jgi:hypothetical protein